MKTVEERFEEFHKANPHIYEKLRDYAFQAKQAGVSTVGIRLLWERLRWEVEVETVSNDAFKLNNNYSSRYVRMLMEREPELDGFFRTRTLQAA